MADKKFVASLESKSHKSPSGADIKKFLASERGQEISRPSGALGSVKWYVEFFELSVKIAIFAN